MYPSLHISAELKLLLSGDMADQLPVWSLCCLYCPALMHTLSSLQWGRTQHPLCWVSGVDFRSPLCWCSNQSSPSESCPCKLASSSFRLGMVLSFLSDQWYLAAWSNHPFEIPFFLSDFPMAWLLSGFKSFPNQGLKFCQKSCMNCHDIHHISSLTLLPAGNAFTHRDFELRNYYFSSLCYCVNNPTHCPRHYGSSSERETCQVGMKM